MRIANSPSYKSRFCELHKPKRINTSPTESGAQSENADNQLGIFIGKRVTRQGDLRQEAGSAGQMGWEQEGDIPLPPKAEILGKHVSKSE